MTRLGGVLASRVTVVVVAVTAIGGGVGYAAAAGSAGPAASVGSSATDDELGASLYEAHCASCHGVTGSGVEDRGPSLEPEGEASVDFVLRTGRMPLADPTMQAKPGPVRFDEAEIRALVAYVGAMGDGPAIPDVDPARGDVSRGSELYRLNCAACHVASGAGAPIGGNRRAPNLLQSTPTEIGEAILVGPGSMPVFGSLSPADIDSIAAYIEELAAENATGASSFGGAGPIAEGLAAWLLALIPLVALTRWIGSPRAGRDRADERDDGRDDGSTVDDADLDAPDAVDRPEGVAPV